MNNSSELDNSKKQLKESFGDKNFILFAALFLIFLVLLYITNDSELFAPLVGVLILLTFYVIGYFRRVKMRNHQDQLAQGKIKYPPIKIDYDKFIEECKSGLMPSCIRVNGKVYSITTQIGESGDDVESFTCYVDDNEIKGLTNFLNYKIDDQFSLNELTEIEFLECNNGDPSKYLIEHKV